MEIKSEIRDKEFFECDCYDRDHLIRAEYSKYLIKYPDGSTSNDRELNILFIIRASDYDNTYRSDNKFMQVKDRLVWRIKKIWQILFSGEIKTEGYFVPCRSLTDTNVNEIENIFGYETTKNFAKWLDTKADELKADYDADLINYNKRQSTPTPSIVVKDDKILE
jgi:hypothetical protein